MCIAYRKLNKAMKKDHFPLPFIDEMLELLVKHSYFCFLDGYASYHQIPIPQKANQQIRLLNPLLNLNPRHHRRRTLYLWSFFKDSRIICLKIMGTPRTTFIRSNHQSLSPRQTLPKRNASDKPCRFPFDDQWLRRYISGPIWQSSQSSFQAESRRSSAKQFF